MTVLIKLFYAGAITTLLILFVAFGIRTFYGPPQSPVPDFSLRFAAPPDGQPAPERRAFEEQQRRQQEGYERYEKKRADYRRNVFIIASIIGVMAVAGGLALPAHLDAMRLGLVGGGLANVLYGVIQAGGDLAKAGPAVVFVVVAVGLVAIMVAGFRWLSRAGERSGA